MPKMVMALPRDMVNYPGGNVQESIYNHGFWAKEESYILLKLLRSAPPESIFLDVGCNTGYFSLLALSVGCKVISIEANPIHFTYLAESVNANKIDGNNIDFLQAFISSKNSVYFDGWSGVEGLSIPELVHLTKTLPIRDIANRAFFTKIDVEGAEPDVISSMGSELESGAFPFIMFESTFIINNNIDKDQVALFTHLLSQGFQIFQITQNLLQKITDQDQYFSDQLTIYRNVHQIAKPDLSYAGHNFLAIHKSVSKVPFISCNDGDSLSIFPAYASDSTFGLVKRYAKKALLWFQSCCQMLF
jgi:FkbM family methyltransferase